jgi:microcystin-dependent protein
MSTAPVPYTETFSFQSFSQENPSTPQPGTQLDNEFGNIANNLLAVINRLALIQRADGAIANGSVGINQLSPNLVLGGIGTPTSWTQNTAYQALNSVIYNASWYWCQISHTSGATFDPTQWTLIYQFTISGLGSNIVATSNIQDQAITASKIANRAITQLQLAYGSVGLLNLMLPFNACAILEAYTITPALFDVSVGALPVGAWVDYGGATAPAGYVFAAGQAISRTAYAALFTVYGTTYGVGDGSTTFNVPDLRSRVVAGLDNMGGTAANRLTTASGPSWTSLGGIGGSELLQSHLHSYPLWKGTPGSGSGELMAGTAYYAAGTQLGTWNTNNTGSGTSQNVQPTFVANKIIFAGA